MTNEVQTPSAETKPKTEKQLNEMKIKDLKSLAWEQKISWRMTMKKPMLVDAILNPWKRKELSAQAKANWEKQYKS